MVFCVTRPQSGCPQRGLLGRVSQKEYNIPIQICTIKRNNLKTYDLFSTIFQESIWNFYQQVKMKNYIAKEWGSILYFYQFGNWKLWYSSKKHNAIKFSSFLANNSFNFLESVGDLNFFVNVSKGMPTLFHERLAIGGRL